MRDKLIDITMASELIVCLVLPVLCSISVLQWHREQSHQAIQRERVASAIPGEMICLSFSVTDKPRVREKNSLQVIDYQGERYHIVRIETVGDTSFFWCLSEMNTLDIARSSERMLARELERNTQRQKQKSLLFNYFQTLYFENTSIELDESFAYLKRERLFTSPLFYMQPFSSPIAPPPKS
jgi:hypothetical protein